MSVDMLYNAAKVVLKCIWRFVTVGTQYNAV